MPNPFLNKTNVPGLRDGTFSPRIEIQLFGKWEETIRTIGRLDPAIKAASLKAQLKVCNVIKTKVLAHLRQQDLNWRPLSLEYAEKKSRLNMDSRILIGQGTYYNSIEVWQKAGNHMVFVGVKKGIYTYFGNRRSKLPVAMIAAIHEFSNGKRVPRRPLWNPTIAEIGGSKGIQKMYINSFIWWLQREGIKVKRVEKIKDILNGFE